MRKRIEMKKSLVDLDGDKMARIMWADVQIVRSKVGRTYDQKTANEPDSLEYSVVS